MLFEMKQLRLQCVLILFFFLFVFVFVSFGRSVYPIIISARPIAICIEMAYGRERWFIMA